MAATAAVLVKFTPEELAAVDRLCAEMGVKRAPWIKRLCADAVAARAALEQVAYESPFTGPGARKSNLSDVLRRV